MCKVKTLTTKDIKDHILRMRIADQKIQELVKRALYEKR